MRRNRIVVSVYLAAALMIAGVMWTGIPSYGAEPSDRAVRTILLYGCGSDLEDEEEGFLSRNLRQILNARIRPDTHIIVMTGGSETWELESAYLDGAERIWNDEKQRHQVWECSGVDADGNHGRLKLLGTVPDTVTKSMSDPDTLQSFIDYGVANYPAEKYDLICWDHGGGPAGGFALDNLDGEKRAFMPVSGIVSAVKNSAVVKDTESGRFDLIDFDACMMGNAEIITCLAPYTDYYVGSAEVEPPYGQEYTAWLNRLYDDPDMDGYTLGREIVDAFDAFYSQPDEEWSGSKVTLAVVNIHNYMTRMLPLLKEMTGILQSEAFDPGAINGKYNFYDELIVSSRNIIYGKEGEGLTDLGDFVSRIGVCLTELDNEPAEEREDLGNRYTDAAVELIRILGDRDFSGDDVIYSRASKSKERLPDYELSRDGQGELTVSLQPVIPGCLSFLFGDSMSGRVPDYVESLNALCSGLAEDSLARCFFDDLKKIALEYAIVKDTGSMISGLSFRRENISYDSVMEKLKGEFYRIDDYIRMAESEGLKNPEDWIRQVIEQHIKEAVREENIFVEVFGTTGENAHRGYYVTIRNSSLKIVDSVKLQMLVGFRDREGKEQMLELGSTEARIALEKMPPGEEDREDPMTAAVQSGFCVFEAEMPEAEWYELSYDGGSCVIALESEEAGNGICAIPVKLIRQDMTDEDLPEYGVLEAIKDPDETLRIIGYKRFDRTPQPTVPLNNDSLDGAKMILLGNVRTGEEEIEVDLCEPIPLTEEEGRGLSISRKPISRIRELDAGKVLAAGKVCDIYSYEYDITEKLREADEKSS